MNYMTQRQEALKGNITEQMAQVARYEGRSAEEIRSGLAKGVISIPLTHYMRIVSQWASARG
jgi:thiamine biosynthesis protein ThiC